MKEDNSALLEVKNLKKYFPVKKRGFFGEPGQVRAVVAQDGRRERGSWLIMKLAASPT